MGTPDINLAKEYRPSATMYPVADILDNRRGEDIYDEKITNDDHHYYIGERGDKSVNTDDKENGFDRLATGVGSGDVASRERNVALDGRAMLFVADKIQGNHPLLDDTIRDENASGRVFFDSGEGPGVDVDGGLVHDDVVHDKSIAGPEGGGGGVHQGADKYCQCRRRAGRSRTSEKRPPWSCSR
jgi:hypothetical protein